jgi:hypothetical protein
MRLLIASLAAFCAVALAAPSVAQDIQPSPAPAAKPKPGTKAYCTSLKKATARDACLKKLHASAAKTKTTTKKTKAKTTNTKKPDTAEAPMTPAPSTAPSPPQTIAVPPLPAKTI